MKRSMVVLVCGLLLATGLLAALWIYSSSRLKQISAQGENTKEYSRHYALITDDYSDQWESIYTSARDRAEEENVYLEWVGEGNPANYAVEDLFRIAAASALVASPFGTRVVVVRPVMRFSALAHFMAASAQSLMAVASA